MIEVLPLEYFLATSVALYVISLYCLATKRNILRLIIGIEILINSAQLNFIVFAASWTTGYVDPWAQLFILISIVLSVCVVAVGLTIIVYAYRHYGTLDARKLARLRW